MNRDASNEWDILTRHEDNALASIQEEQERSRPGLYSKFAVTNREGDPLEVGSFCLVPFHKDGTVRDVHAITALRAYIEAANNKELSEDVERWINNPLSFEWLNEPRF